MPGNDEVYVWGTTSEPRTYAVPTLLEEFSGKVRILHCIFLVSSQTRCRESSSWWRVRSIGLPCAKLSCCMRVRTCALCSRVVCDVWCVCVYVFEHTQLVAAIKQCDPLRLSFEVVPSQVQLGACERMHDPHTHTHTLNTHKTQQPPTHALRRAGNVEVSPNARQLRRPLLCRAERTVDAPLWHFDERGAQKSLA